MWISHDHIIVVLDTEFFKMFLEKLLATVELPYPVHVLIPMRVSWHSTHSNIGDISRYPQHMTARPSYTLPTRTGQACKIVIGTCISLTPSKPVLIDRHHSHPFLIKKVLPHGHTFRVFGTRIVIRYHIKAPLPLL
jgi:hypothetical protein